jgi:hypothetical protein
MVMVRRKAKGRSWTIVVGYVAMKAEEEEEERLHTFFLPHTTPILMLLWHSATLALWASEALPPNLQHRKETRGEQGN